MEASFAVSKKPLAVFSIVEREGLERAIWTRVGTAFKNRDGSMNVHLDALPTNGKLHVREQDPNRSRMEQPRADAGLAEEVRS